MIDIATYSPTLLATPVGERDDDITKIMDMGFNEDNEVLYLVGYRNPNLPYSLCKESEILDGYMIEIYCYYFEYYPNIGFVPNAVYTERDLLQYFTPQSEYTGESQLNASHNDASSIESSNGERVENNENGNEGLLVDLEGEIGTNTMYNEMNVDDDSYDYINLQYVDDVSLSNQNLFGRRTTNLFGTPNGFIDEEINSYSEADLLTRLLLQAEGIHLKDGEQLTGEPMEGISATGTIMESESVRNEDTPMELLFYDQTSGLDVSSSSSIQFDLIDLGASNITVSLIGEYYHIQQDAYVEETSGNTSLEWENIAIGMDEQTAQSNNESQFNASSSEVIPRSEKPKNIFIRACENYDPNRGFIFEDYIHFGGFIGEFKDGKRYSLCHKENGIIILNEKQIPADVLRTLTRN